MEVIIFILLSIVYVAIFSLSLFALLIGLIILAILFAFVKVFIIRIKNILRRKKKHETKIKR